MGTFRCGKCKKTFYFNESVSLDEYVKMKSADENSVPDIKNFEDLSHIKKPKVCPHCGARIGIVTYELPNNMGSGSDKKSLIAYLVVAAILYFPLFYLFGGPIFAYFSTWPFGEVLSFGAILLMDLVIVLMMSQPPNYRVRY